MSVWIQVRPDILLGLIWFQTVCKGYQQTTLVGGKELNSFSVNNQSSIGCTLTGACEFLGYLRYLVLEWA